MSDPLPAPAADPSITAIRVLPSDPNQRSVAVDGRVVARLSALDVEAMGLEVGTRWTPALERRVQRSRRLDLARRQALQMLGRRAFAQRELAERLQRRGHDPDVCRNIVREFVDQGWLDDEAFARDAAVSLLRGGAMGRDLLAQRLVARGVDAALAERAARAALAGRDEDEDARRLVEDRVGPLRDDRTARRAAALLTRRGFDEDTVVRTIETLRR